MAIAFVQQASQINSVAGTTITATVSALTTGNWLVVAANQNSTPGMGNVIGGLVTLGSGSIQPWSISSTATPGAARSDPLTLVIARITSGGTTSVTFTGTSGALAMEVIEFSATNQLILDVCKVADGTATSVTTGNVATTGFANELWIGATTFRNDTISSQQLNGTSPDNSYNAVTTGFTTTANRGVALAYKIASATGTPAYTATLNQASAWVAGIMCFREIPSAAANTYSKSVLVNRRF